MKQSQQISGDFLHKEYPKQFERNEFWQQIKRTVNGKPVSEDEIELIVEQVVTQLDLSNHDHVLDLGCGNGALASRLFGNLQSYTGVDFSEYLLEIANEYFAPHDQVRYRAADIRSVESYANGLEQVNKVLCYGCIAYLSKEEVVCLLQNLRQFLPSLKKLFFGNIPRKEKASEFFLTRGISEYVLDDPTSAIGVWWEAGELERVAAQLGYIAKRSQMSAGFYGATYRFDLLMELDVNASEVGEHD